MKASVLAANCLILAALVHGLGKEPSEVAPETFRFLRMERTSLPPNAGIDQNVTTRTYCIFAFRYSGPRPLAFWGFGQPEGRKFVPRFSEYRTFVNADWESDRVAYCGTGAATYLLQPGVDYELWIFVPASKMRAGAKLKVSAKSPEGTFWSDPLTIAK
jgi:hypothetical protein